MRVRVLVNPTAGSGTARRKMPETERALERAGVTYEWALTERPGDARRLVDKARADGVECLAVMGGDGTLNEVAQAYLDGEGKPLDGPDLAVIPAGTGGDFRKTFGLMGGIEEAVGRLSTAKPRPMDLGALTLTADDGSSVSRAFINITSFGIGGLTDRIVNQSPKWMGGRAAFFVGTLRAMIAYKNAPVSVRVDGRTILEGPIFNVAIANGQYFGGGMKIAPDADPGDGQFDVVAMGDLTALQSIGLSRRVYEGSHLTAPGITHARGIRVEADPLGKNDEVLIDMDGETPGRLPLVAWVARGAVRIRA
jgi:diacylglycerol kinase (ATP)